MALTTNKHIDAICIVVVALAVVLTVLFMFGDRLGIQSAERTMKYEKTLFDNSYVHQIDIVMDDWDGFIETCESEEYSSCTIVVDGDKHTNVAIRAKGNTSLSNVKSMGSQRYSFKLEFDHYESGKSLDGLDKLCLNNLIQDNTMMKDYIAYLLMADFGVDAPLVSFVYVRVNGEDWGLYLAVEGIEDSFLQRNYGSNIGDLYKPDSLSFGGGRGNGKDFKMDDLDFDFDFDTTTVSVEPETTNDTMAKQMGFGGMQAGGMQPTADMQVGAGMQAGGGMGSSDVKLQYIDDDPDSYSNIFDNAKTDVTAADQKRLISSLKSLSQYTDLEDVLDIDEVLRYFVVHNFLCNGDSYTGTMVHNYYLHESDGKLEMIPWDYNLAYGTFSGGDTSGTINTSIDSPVSGGMSDRPMVAWIFSEQKYTDMYHELFSEFVEKWFSNGQLESLIRETAQMIAPYVEKDPTKFCTTSEFETGVDALASYANLRGEAISRQLKGDTTYVDTTGLNLSDMGTMGGNAGFGGGSMPDMSQISESFGSSFGGGNMPGGMGYPGGQTATTDMTGSTNTMPDMSQMGGSFPGGGVMQNGNMQNGTVQNGMMPTGMGNQNGQTTTDDTSNTTGTTMPDMSKMGGSFPGGGNMQNGTMPNGMMPNGQTAATTDTVANASGPALPDTGSRTTGKDATWIIVLASALVLGIGIFFVFKKKY